MAGDSRYKALDSPIVQFLFYATVFWIPFYRWRHLSQRFEFLKVDWLLVMAIAAILVPCFVIEKGIPDRLKTNLGPLYLLFLAANIIASALSPYPDVARSGIQTLIIGYMFIALAQLVVNKKGYVHIYPVVLCSCITLSAFLAILGFYLQIDILTLGVTTGTAETALRGVGGSIGANNSALMYIFILPILVHWCYHGRNRLSKTIAVAQMFIVVMGIVSTLSRGGFLMLLLIGSLILWEQRHRFHPRYVGLVLAAVGVLVMIAVVVVPDTFIQRQQTLAQGTEADMAMSRRAAYLVVGWQSFAEKPFFGKGTDTFRYVWHDSLMSGYYKREYRYAHNTYVEVLVGSGIIGLALFLGILARALWNYVEAEHWARKAGAVKLASLCNAYRISFICIATYLLILSSIEHKLLLLALAFSQISIRVAAEVQKPGDITPDVA